MSIRAFSPGGGPVGAKLPDYRCEGAKLFGVSLAFASEEREFPVGFQQIVKSGAFIWERSRAMNYSFRQSY